MKKFLPLFFGASACSGSLLIGGEPRELTSVKATTNQVHSGSHLDIQLASDPDPYTTEDNLLISLSLIVFKGFPYDEPMEINIGEYADAELFYECSCSPGGTDPLEIEGTLTLHKTLGKDFRGELELRFRGADKSGIDLGEVELQLPFRAPFIYVLGGS